MTTHDTRSHISRRRFLSGSAAASIGISLSTRPVAAHGDGSSNGGGDVTRVSVKQEPDQLVYWVLPGRRRLSEKVFGTPEEPKSLVKPVIERAKKPPIKELLRTFPLLVGLPQKARAVSEDGERYTHSKIPTPFGDDAEVIDGSFDVTYVDRQPEDGQGSPTKTDDALEMREVQFTDSELNEYTLRQKTLFQPPIPGYQTGGGVFTNRYHHGLTGTGSPLMPRVYSWGASYSLGSIVANGEVVDTNRVFHWMTTQTVRTDLYRLAIEEELPLAPENTIAGQRHHTHLIVLPVRLTEQGVPEFKPVDIPYSGKQPFIHVMYEEDEVTEAPFDPPNEILDAGEGTPTQAPTDEDVPGILVEGSEFFFDPHRIEATAGEEVVITFRNVGSVAHNFIIGDLEVATPTLQPGQTATVRFAPERPDVYGFWCYVPGHQDAGMQGRLVVKPTETPTTTESRDQ